MPEYTAYIYDGEPGDGVELKVFLKDPSQPMLVDLPLESGQLFGTRAMFWQDGKRWIKTVQALLDDVIVLCTLPIPVQANDPGLTPGPRFRGPVLANRCYPRLSSMRQLDPEAPTYCVKLAPNRVHPGCTPGLCFRE